MNDDEVEIPYEVASAPAYEVMRGISDSLPEIFAILRSRLKSATERWCTASSPWRSPAIRCSRCARSSWYERRMRRMAMAEADGWTEFECTECGRHIVRYPTMSASEPRLCAECIHIPGWFRNPELAAVLDPEFTPSDEAK